MKKLTLAASLVAFLISPLSTHAQVTKPPIPNVAGATTSAQFGSIITNPFGSPSTGDRVLFATPANNGILVTNGTGVPSISSTLPAHTLGGTVSGGGNQLNNVIIGTTTPLAGSFTTISSKVGTNENLQIRDQGGTLQIRAVNDAAGAFVNLLVDALNINFNSQSGGTQTYNGLATFNNGITVASGDLTVSTGNLAVVLANNATTSAVCYNTGTNVFTYNSTIGTCTVSALRYKNPIANSSLENSLTSVVDLRTEAWTYKDGMEKDSGFDSRVHVGLYADDVEKMDKRCVSYKDGKVENYDDRCILAYVVAALKTLKTDNDNLTTELNKLRQ